MDKRTNTAKWDDKRKTWKINVQRDGVRRSFYSSTPGKEGQREANQKADEWLKTGLKVCRKRFAEAATEWWEYEKRNTSPDTSRVQYTVLMSRIIPSIGNVKVSALSDDHLQRVIDKAYCDGCSKNYMQNVKSIMIAVVKYCRRKKYCDFRPEFVEIPKNAKIYEREILQPDEIKTLFTEPCYTTVSGKRVLEPYILAFRFNALTGLRPSELLGLKPDDVTDDGVLSIRRGITVSGHISEGKNQNARRSFRLSEQALCIWKEQVLKNNGEYVFGIKSEETYRRHLARYCKSNNIRVVTPYCLRHTFISLNSTIPIQWLKEIVGHSIGMDTLKQYGHAVDGDDIKAAQVVTDNFLNVLK